MSRTFLVSNRLPVRIRADGTTERTTGGLASALAGASIEATWVGWPGVCTEDVSDLPALRGQLADLGVEPVFLDRAEYDGHYEGYANATLWPLLHSMPTRASFHPPWFEAYEAVNRHFAEAVTSVARDGDTVWIHDFHLFLLPRLLREASVGLRIGFFLHTPFPSSEVFRILPERDAVLEGLLGADLIGFHTYGYLRHFRSALLRGLGIESEVDFVRQHDHVAALGVHPIGHDQTGFAGALADDRFAQACDQHRRLLGERRLVLSVERLDYTKGIPHKLAAMRRFLQDYPERRYDTVFLLIAVPSRQGIAEYDELTEEVQREVGAINGEFGTLGHVPVQFLHRSLSQSELAALYALAEVCLVTPLVDGMNLVAKEYIACQHMAPALRPGVLVLSEFAGAAQEMSDALLVNPYDVAGVAAAINEALGLDKADRRQRIASMGPRLVRNDASAWARSFLARLGQGATSGGSREPTPGLAGLAADIATSVRGGRRLALFLDYDGTLRGFEGTPEAAVPDEDLRSLLRDLAADPRVSVTIVSGRPSDFLEEHLGDLGVELVAEHGYRWRRTGSGDWTFVYPDVDASWKSRILPALQQAVDLTPGSSLEEKASALVWHYRRAEPEFGAWRAHMLLSELTGVTANLPVVVHHGRKIVEVASLAVSKGGAVRRLLAELSPDVAVVAGDDQTDETMFVLEPGPDLDFHTVCVGEAPSRATRRSDIAGLRSFLEFLRTSLLEMDGPAGPGAS